MRGRTKGDFEITLFSDLGEAESKKVHQLCNKYGVVKQSTAGYTPEHNAFVERWFRTNAEMSRCQMLQYDSPEALWEDSRRMATFIYNRVPPTKQIPGEPWKSPLALQYPDRKAVDLTKIQPFGLTCWVHQKKQIRDQGYGGKSDKKQQARQGILVGYNDQMGPLRAKVYFTDTTASDWYAEELLEYRDPLYELEMKSEHVPVIECEPKEIEYFTPLVGTRHVDPTSGLQYEVVQVKLNRQRYIVVYRRRVSHGEVTGALDGPIHAEEVVRWTKDGINYLKQFNSSESIVNVDSTESQASPRTSGKRGRSSISTSSGESITSGLESRPNLEKPNSKKQSKGKASGSGLVEGTRNQSLLGSKMAPIPLQRQQPNRSSKRTSGYVATDHAEAHLAQVASTIAAAATSGDMFSMLAVDDIKRQEVLVPSKETLLLPDYEPSQRKYMLQCDKHKEWKIGEQEEITSIKDNKVWEKVDMPYGTKPLPLKWIYKTKKDRLGVVSRYKCRLVAQGFFQVHGQDYSDTYSPVCKFTSIRTLLAITAQLGLKVHAMDVDTAFLNAPITEDIWVQVPKGTELPVGDNGIYKLKKSLYGLKQAPREWNQMINGVLLDMGFEPLEADPCIYKKTVRGMVNGVMKDKHYIIALYVDDLLIACSTPQMCNELERAFKKHFKMKILGSIKHILGMDVYNNLDEHKVFISQRQYIADSVKRYSKYNLRAFSTPIDNRQPYMKSQCPEAGSPEATRMLQMPYRELVGTLLWIANGTRPDIAFAVTTLAKYTSNPGEIHWQALLRVLGYLQVTIHHCICYTRNEEQDNGITVSGHARGILPSMSDFKCYVDASYAGDEDTRRSTTGYMFKICGGPVSWQSRMQTSVALSSMESEYMAASAAAQEALWLNRLLQQLGLRTPTPTVLYEDNKAAILFADHPGDHRRSKHIDTRRHFVRETVVNGEIALVYIPTAEQQADGLTKALPLQTHQTLCLNKFLVQYVFPEHFH